MIKENSSFLSTDEMTDISVTTWLPDGEPSGVLQICHGMLEFIDRYEDFAKYLTNRGFVVTGHDHIGHGDSVMSVEARGFFHDEIGNEILIGDIKKMMDLSKEKWPDKDYFIMGHSMGSFLVRQFMFTYPEEKVNGCILVGTGQKPKALVKLGRFLAEREGRKKGWKSPNEKVTEIFMKESLKKIKNPRTPNDWLTKDENIVDAYNSDPRCTFRFSNRAYYDMFSGMLTLYSQENVDMQDKDVPYFFISGEDDPVGDFGKGVKKVYHQYIKSGFKDVSIRLFQNDRHEIINETDREEVYFTIYNWMMKKKSI